MKKKKSNKDSGDEEYAKESGLEDEEEEHAGSHDDEKVKIEEGTKEENVYSEEGREEERESDEIDDWEEGFAEGAESKSPLRKIKKKKEQG